MIRVLLIMTCLSLLACGPAAYRWDADESRHRDQVYVVKSGDTLYSIAFRYGMDYRELARLNGIGQGYMIFPGQRLKLLAGQVATDTNSSGTAAVVATAPGTMPLPVATSAIAWIWPVTGDVIAKFGEQTATGKGINIGGTVGSDILAAADGKVVYAGSGLIGYGRIIIIKHSDEFLSAYGHNQELFINEGEQVKQGDRIASMGRGPGNQPLLHFEIRVNGKAVDPLRYLPRR